MELTALAVSVAFLFSHIKAGTSFYEKPFKIGVPTDLNDKRTKVAEIDMQPGAWIKDHEIPKILLIGINSTA